jgi:glutathione peroxidase
MSIAATTTQDQETQHQWTQDQGRRFRMALPARGAYRHSLDLVDGTRLSLSTRRGRPTLIVNIATDSAYTRQLRGLQYLYERYRDRGLLVVGCPSTDFGAAEASEPAEIARVCNDLYDVTFPISEPMRVLLQPDSLWRDLAAQPQSGPPVWDFNKYLLDGNGRVCGWWSTNVQPNHPRIREAIARQLA